MSRVFKVVIAWLYTKFVNELYVPKYSSFTLRLEFDHPDKTKRGIEGQINSMTNLEGFMHHFNINKKSGTAPNVFWISPYKAELIVSTNAKPPSLMTISKGIELTNETRH